MTSHGLSLTWQLPLPQHVRNAVPGKKAFGHRLFLKISSTVSLRISCLSSQFGSEFSLEHIDLKCFLKPIEMMVKKFKGEYIHKSRHKGRKIIRGADKLKHF